MERQEEINNEDIGQICFQEVEIEKNKIKI